MSLERRFFWERVAVELGLRGSRVGPGDRLDLGRATGDDLVTGSFGDRQLRIMQFLLDIGDQTESWTVALAAVEGLPDGIEVEADHLGTVAAGDYVRERVRCGRGGDKSVFAASSVVDVGGLELVATGDLLGFIERATPKVICALSGGVRIVDGQHWVFGMRNGDFYPSKRVLRRATEGNTRALANMQMYVEDAVAFVELSLRDADAISQRFPKPPPPPSARAKTRR
jgi:hypothetical protein